MSEPSCREEQINRMVTVDVARFDQEAANRPDNENRLPLDCRKLKLNPVVGTRKVTLCGLNAGYIGVKVSVKIINCKLWSRSDRSNRRTLNIRRCRGAAPNKAKEQQ